MDRAEVVKKLVNLLPSDTSKGMVGMSGRAQPEFYKLRDRRNRSRPHGSGAAGRAVSAGDKVVGADV